MGDLDPQVTEHRQFLNLFSVFFLLERKIPVLWRELLPKFSVLLKPWSSLGINHHLLNGSWLISVYMMQACQGSAYVDVGAPVADTEPQVASCLHHVHGISVLILSIMWHLEHL